MPAGQQLKSLRNKRNITVRDVEQASRRIAEAKGDKRFRISNGWLAQLENGDSEPSICKLFSLSVIYHVNFLDLVRLYNVDVDDKEKYGPVVDPHLTQLLKNNGRSLYAPSSSEAPLSTRLVPEFKTIGPRQFPALRDPGPNIIFAHLGLNEFTMYPMIRPSALLKIDTSQNKPGPAAWRNEYERPIFFIELREAYACGWCELQGKQLLIIPHPLSPASVRRFTYPREAEIVGRVIGYNTHCMDLEPRLAEIRRSKVLPARSSG